MKCSLFCLTILNACDGKEIDFLFFCLMVLFQLFNVPFLERRRCYGMEHYTRFSVPSPGHSMSPFELCAHDDAASAIAVDPILGFRTHKMDVKYVVFLSLVLGKIAYFFHFSFLPLSAREQLLCKEIIRFFRDNGNLGSCINQLCEVCSAIKFFILCSSDMNKIWLPHLC